jgi:hypothetical protein
MNNLDLRAAVHLPYVLVSASRQGSNLVRNANRYNHDLGSFWICSTSHKDVTREVRFGDAGQAHKQGWRYQMICRYPWKEMGTRQAVKAVVLMVNLPLLC